MSHHHHDHHGNSAELSFDEKIEKLLLHWIQHNEDHAKTYMEWGQKAKSHGLEEIAQLLEKAAEMTESINKEFRNAASLCPGKGDQ